MKKRLVAFIFVLLLVTLPVLCSCGASNEMYDMSMTANGKYYTEDMMFDVAETTAAETGVEYEYYAKSEGISSYKSPLKVEENTALSTQNTAPNAAAGRKIIYTSNYDIETKEFDKCVAALNALCEKYGAYYENSNTYGSPESSRRSSFTVRVPVENYRAFISDTQEIGVIVSASENNQDITERYYDTEARLESALIREERVLEILKNSSQLDDVLALERELADIRYEIESMTGTLRKYDSLVSYSTVSVSVREIRTVADSQKKVLTFGERVNLAFTSGIEEFVDGVESFIVYLSYNLIGILVFIVIVLIVFIVIINIRRKRCDVKKKAQAAAQTANNNEKTEN